MSKPKTKRWLSFFDEIKDLGAGGNADVYLVTEKTSGCQYALKELRNRNEEKKSRFISEIQIAKENSAIIPGIIPVIADDCENYWYTMPIAQPVMEFINEKNLQEIVNGVLQLCETLEQLHDKRIHHRDIKPSNIYYYEGRFSLGDFGLVDFPDNDDFTRSDQGLGAIFTIAPEMKRNPKVADASKADVFSLAKTLWMFLSGDEKGFDGVYNHLDESHSLRYVSRFKDVVLCQEKVQIKCNQFSFFVIVNSLSLLRPFPSFSDIVPHIHLETNIHNDYEYGLYYRMFQYIQKLVYMHECS